MNEIAFQKLYDRIANNAKDGFSVAIREPNGKYDEFNPAIVTVDTMFGLQLQNSLAPIFILEYFDKLDGKDDGIINLTELKSFVSEIGNKGNSKDKFIQELETKRAQISNILDNKIEMPRGTDKLNWRVFYENLGQVISVLNSESPQKSLSKNGRQYLESTECGEKITISIPSAKVVNPRDYNRKTEDLLKKIDKKNNNNGVIDTMVEAEAALAALKKDTDTNATAITALQVTFEIKTDGTGSAKITNSNILSNNTDLKISISDRAATVTGDSHSPEYWNIFFDSLHAKKGDYLVMTVEVSGSFHWGDGKVIAPQGEVMAPDAEVLGDGTTSNNEYIVLDSPGKTTLSFPVPKNQKITRLEFLLGAMSEGSVSVSDIHLEKK